MVSLYLSLPLWVASAQAWEMNIGLWSGFHGVSIMYSGARTALLHANSGRTISEICPIGAIARLRSSQTMHLIARYSLQGFLASRGQLQARDTGVMIVEAVELH